MQHLQEFQDIKIDDIVINSNYPSLRQKTIEWSEYIRGDFTTSFFMRNFVIVVAYSIKSGVNKILIADIIANKFFIINI